MNWYLFALAAMVGAMVVLALIMAAWVALDIIGRYRKNKARKAEKAKREQEKRERMFAEREAKYRAEWTATMNELAQM